MRDKKSVELGEVDDAIQIADKVLDISASVDGDHGDNAGYSDKAVCNDDKAAYNNKDGNGTTGRWLMAGSQHNNQLTICHEGGNVLAAQCPIVNESPTRQSHRNAVAISLLHLELSDMRKLVVIVSLVDNYLVHDF
jgi:hypothetical protein